MNINKSLNGLSIIGESKKEEDGVIIEGKLKGYVEVECIKCLEKFKKEIDEEIKFKVVKPPFNGFDEKYDIIEQEKFDVEEILKSEMESIKNDYNVCKNCKDKEFNKEF